MAATREPCANNISIIGLFPSTSEVDVAAIDRRKALLMLWRVAAAARAAIDEITTRTPEMNFPERRSSDQAAEQLAASALRFSQDLELYDLEISLTGSG